MRKAGECELCYCACDADNEINQQVNDYAGIIVLLVNTEIYKT